MIPHVKLARTRAELPPYQPGHWVVAGTPADQPYPCTCWYSPCNYPKCPDQQRTEGDALPAGCCGRASGSHGERPDRPGGHSNAQAARSSKWRPEESPRQGWERSVGPQHRAAAVSQPLGGSLLVAGDLWAAPWDAEPAPWDLDEPAPSANSHDEASRLATETLNPGDPGTNGDVPTRQHSGASDGRQRSAVEHCQCPTPWDPPPPVLLVAESKTGPVRVAVALDPPRDGGRVDLRDYAEELLAARGYGVKGSWKDGRHTLLPPEGKLKTRPGFLAEVFNVAPGLRESALAVIDTPPERGTGVHCVDDGCHRHFANASAYEMHRRKGNGIDWPRWAERCVDPGTIRVVPRSPGSAGGPASISRQSRPGQYDGAPLLKRGANGIWQLDPLAPWGPGGPPFGPAKAMEIYERGRREIKRWQFGKGHNRR